MRDDDEIERYSKLAMEFDPTGLQPKDMTDARAIAQAVDRGDDEAHIRELVQRACANGCSWGEVAIALGTSRADAQARFGG
jgi:hypothetical protein